MLTRQKLQRYDSLMDELCDLFDRHAVPPTDGEEIFLWLAGCSAGRRQASIIGNFLQPLAIGWRCGAGDDSERTLSQ